MRALRDLNWNHLYYFYEVSRNQSIKKAAIALDISISNLSEQLKKLEKKLDKQLFQRTNRGMLLTPIGSELFEHAKHIFEEGNKLLEKFSEDFVGGYPVTVGIEESMSFDIPVEFVSQYWDLYAPFGIVNTIKQMGQENLVENIKNDSVDWGISLKPTFQKGLKSAKIGEFELIFICSKKLYKKFHKKEDILVNIPFAQNTWDKALNEMIYQYLAGYQIFPKEIIHSDHYYYLENLCKRGRCVMAIPDNPLKKYPGLEKYQLSKPLKVNFYVIWKEKNEGKIAIQKLMSLIKSKLTQFPDRYEDVDLQIEASEISEDLLT